MILQNFIFIFFFLSFKSFLILIIFRGLNCLLLNMCSILTFRFFVLNRTKLVSFLLRLRYLDYVFIVISFINGVAFIFTVSEILLHLRCNCERVDLVFVLVVHLLLLQMLQIFESFVFHFLSFFLCLVNLFQAHEWVYWLVIILFFMFAILLYCLVKIVLISFFFIWYIFVYFNIVFTITCLFLLFTCNSTSTFLLLICFWE